MAIEVSFPRGGRKPPPNAKPKDIRGDHDLFGRKRKKVSAKVRKANVIQEKDDTSKTVEIQHVEQLSGKTIQDGMVLLGCIKEIQKVALEISLPGRLWGKVFVNNVSKPYTKLLQSVVDETEVEGYKPLNELFTLGQCVAVRILNLNDEKFGITLSMMPQQINSNISHTSIKKGMTLWAAISEIEDHGYVVDLGINNCRAFLKKENCDKNKDYVVGELLWIVVTKTDISSTATTVMLNAQREKVRNMTIHDDVSLDHLLPGMQVNFTISEVLSNGLEGKFFNDYTGYIDVGQLKKSLHVDDSDYKVENILQARILYMMPVTKIAYFTLKSLEPHKRDKIKDGAIMNCKVQGVTPLGVYVKLGTTDSRGFVPIHRARKNNSFNEGQSDYIYLKRNYTKHSNHQCRILNYDYFEQIYVCSMERKLIDKSMIFTLDNLKAAQTVSAEITEIQPNGLLVKVDQIKGFIKNEHICDTVLKNYNNIKSRLKVGQTVQARVWVINKQKHVLYLTMRPSLIKEYQILKNYDQARPNQQYLGVIRQITTHGLLVQFFGDIHGWVPNKKMKFGDVDHPINLFKVGQLVKCTVVNCEKQRLTLSLYSPDEITEDVEITLKLGEHVDAIVSHITNDGVHVKVKDSEISAFIPSLYFSKFPKLASMFANMYQPGDEISNLVCISKNDALPVLSLRNPEITEENIMDITDVQKGTILSCSVLTTDSFGINLEAPIQNFKKTILVPTENISDDHRISISSIKLNQFIYAKVFNKHVESITASTKLSDVWDFDIQSTVQYFSEYLNEFLRIKEHYKSLKSPVAALELGEVVSGVVRIVNDDKSCIVQLENGAKAVVHPAHIKENVAVNDKVEGVVLFWDFENNAAEIALCPKLISRINSIQNGNTNITPGVTNKSNSHAEVILVKDDFVLGVLRGAAGKRQLIFFPSRLHPNDLKPNLNDYIIGDYINIQVNKVENGLIIGLLKQLVRDMNYKWKNNLKYKRENNSEDQREPKRIKVEHSNNDDNKKNKNKKDKENNVDNNDVKKSNKKKNKEITNETPLESKKVKKEKKTSISTDDEIIGETKKRKTKTCISDNEEIITKKQKLHKDMKQKNDVVDKKELVKVKKIKKEKKTSISTDDETVEDTTIISDNEEIVTKKHKNKKGMKKQNISEDEEPIEISEQKKTNKKQAKRKLDETTEKQINENKKFKTTIQKTDIDKVAAVLPGADNFWNIADEQEIVEESSDDDEPDQKELEKLQKKKKLTPAERAEAARLEEERIRKIELELADSESTPKTANQFDRLVLANPNNSLYWINYMAFQLEATEIEKARAIARKALNTIEFREEQEKLNVWIAFLNLECRYGTKESFATVLEEAVKMNDSLSVYLQALNILSDAGKTTEFLELVKTVSKKFKQEFKMWTEAAEACYKCDLKEEARNLMQRSLKSLDEKQHVNILVQFAFMESRHNEPERAEALLEKVLASYPRRVDVWTSYVDLLIKGNRIHIARNVLERATGQKLPARKMKTIFSKFVQFETKYGDEESVKKVRQLAANYVKTALN